jgi:hypothetical protein
LRSNVGQDRFEALDVTVNVADEGSFHACGSRFTMSRGGHLG